MRFLRTNVQNYVKKARVFRKIIVKKSFYNFFNCIFALLLEEKYETLKTRLHI